MERLVALLVLAGLLGLGEVRAQPTGGDATVTAPDFTAPGTALPHPDERMPTSTGRGNSSPPKYSSKAAAVTACGQDRYNWFDPATNMLLRPSDRLFGKTAHGFYACQN